MKLTQKITLIVLGFFISSLSVAHEGIHAAGQAHVGESHMGLFEVALAMIATVLVVAHQIKKYKSRK